MHCNNLVAKIKELGNIVYHVQMDPEKRIIIRDSNCLSCSTQPAVEKFKPKRERGEANKPHDLTEQENNVHVRPCYPGEPIKHSIDPR